MGSMGFAGRHGQFVADRDRAVGIPMPEAGVVLGAGLGPGGAIAGGAPVPKLQMPTALTRQRLGVLWCLSELKISES